MRKWQFAGALAVVAGIPALAVGCEPPPLGELVLIVKTDMAPPKDFNKMQIQVFNEGSLKFKYEGPVPGDPGEKLRIVLPSTLGLVAPEDPSNSIRIEVGVRSGGKEGPVRVVREVVTTIPADRVAMLDLPIQFLCKKDDIPFDNNGDLKPSDCEDGKTCIAGSCQDSKVDSTTLPDYDSDSVYGGSGDPSKGVCFDVASCFSEAILIDTAVLTAACTFPVPAGIDTKSLNLALGVESDGVCNGLGCFVVLDAASDTGWKVDESGENIVLPQGVCDNLTNQEASGLKVLQLVQAQTGADCPQKDVSYPTCGPWSAVESQPPPPYPTAIAGAQDHPISVAVLGTADGSFAYWTTSGDSSIKATSLEGGALISIDSTEPPRDIVATETALLWTAAGANGVGSVYAYLANPPQGQDPLVQLQTGLAQPDGMAFFSDKNSSKVFWAEFSDNTPPGRVLAGTLNASFTAFTDVTELSTGDAYPVRIVADSSYIYWTNEGSAGKGNGSVRRFQHANPGSTPVTLTTEALDAPRALALDIGSDGLAKDLYFATITDGVVWRIPNVSSATPGAAEQFITGLSAPNGIAVDGKNVYVANRGGGTIVYKPKEAAAGDPATKLASGQKNPGTILVSGDNLLWVNEGPSDASVQGGSIIKFDKSQL